MFDRFRDWFGPAAPAGRAPSIPRARTSNKGEVLEIHASVAINSGCVRTENQDGAIFTRPSDDRALATHGVIALVADGMGGCNGGEVASALACEKIPKVYFASNGPAPAALRASLESVNGEIYQTAQAQPHLHGMGTTAVAFAITSSHGWLAYVGDSRLYLIRRGQIYRMSEDHSMVFEMVHKGLLTPEEARNHADRNVLSRALGSRPQVEVSCWDEPFPIQAGDRFLLCSDGLHDLVSDEKMLALARTGELNVATEKLVRTANENGGYDNISVILLEAVDAAALRSRPGPTREYQVP
ncbi:MAG TPA: PP2C family serine/threonine-protein phosphatase [Bryobacteraceae bacterium]|jgi:protein phosphatase|nr:PP2C family serine/threonine-protein phosphatase [Bryobacteraceae bacterium]